MSIVIVPQRGELSSAILSTLNTTLAARFGGSATPVGPPGPQTPRRAWVIDDAPKAGGDYVTIFLNRDEAGTYRIGGVGLTMWRLTVRAVGSVSNVALLLDICGSALEEHSVVVGGLTSGSFRFAGGEQILQDYADQSLYFGDIDFTFAF